MAPGGRRAEDCGSGSESMNATRPPGLSQRRTRARKVASAGAGDMAQPEAREDRIDLAVRLGPRVPDVQVGPQAVCHQPLAGALQRRGVRVIQRELTLVGQQRRPPAGARRQVDDLAADGQRIEPSSGGVELGVPRSVMDRTTRVPAPPQVPVVVLRRARLVVRDQRGFRVSSFDHLRDRGGRLSP